MKKQGTLLKRTILAGALIISITVAYGAGNKKKDVKSSNKVFTEQLNKIINVVEEMELKLESWMTKDSFLENACASEPDLNIEYWMLDQEIFNQIESHEELELESWMSDSNFIEKKVINSDS